MASLDSDIASLSAQALNNLSKGSFQESSRIWSCVLRQLLPHVLDSSEDGGGAVFQFGGPARCGGVQIRCLSSLESTPSPTGDRIFAVFPRFFLPEESSTYGWTLEDYRLVAAATVYNIALSHHLQGLLRSDNREDYVRHSKRTRRPAICCVPPRPTSQWHLGRPSCWPWRYRTTRDTCWSNRTTWMRRRRACIGCTPCCRIWIGRKIRSRSCSRQSCFRITPVVSTCTHPSHNRPTVPELPASDRSSCYSFHVL